MHEGNTAARSSRSCHDQPVTARQKMSAMAGWQLGTPMAAGKCSLSLLRADRIRKTLTERRNHVAGAHSSGTKGLDCLRVAAGRHAGSWAWQPWAGPRTGVVRLAEHPLTHTVVATGYVSNTEESVLGATLTARVASLPVEEGQSVRAGDVLIRLESAEAAAAVEQARGNARQADATLAEARRQFRRQQQLFAQGFISQAALDAEDKKVRLAAALADTAHAAVTQAGAHLDEFTVRAPADGRLVSRQVEAGDLVTAGKPVLTFARQGRGEVRLDVDERYLARLAVGQPVVVAPDAFPDRQFRMRIVRIAPQVDRDRGTVEVRVAGAPLPAGLTHNMTVSAEIVVAQKPSALTLPAAAIWEAQGREYVWRVENGRVRPVAVIVSPAAESRVEVLKGLKAGDLVVSSALMPLTAGQRVRTDGPAP